MKRRTGIAVVVLLIVLPGFIGKRNVTPYTFPELKYFPEMPQSFTNPVTVEGVELGRYLFYDPVLSLDSSMSCGSCHRQEKAFSDSPNRYSAGMSGQQMERNTLPLFNLAWYPSLFWDGRAGNLEVQVFQPVRAHNEMNLAWPTAVKRIRNDAFYRQKFREAFGDLTIDSVLIAKAIAQFERTLLSYRSKYDSALRGETYLSAMEYEGFVLVNDMTKGNCLHCHTTDADPLGTTLQFSNNGLDKVSDPQAYADKGLGGITGKTGDYGKFKIPSLRNLVFTAPYMHDGRFATLEEVLDFYSEGVNETANIDSKMNFAHQHGVNLSCGEKEKIIAFLLTLTDSSFVTDPAFGSPFRK